MRPEHIKYIVIHCSATKPRQDIGAGTIDEWHKARGWSGIGYHFVIRRDGRLELGRPINAVGAHAFGYNRVSWGICLIGGLDYLGQSVNNFTGVQMVGLGYLVMALKAFAPDAEVVGHRDLSPDVNGDGVIEKWEWKKDCPCFDVPDWYAQIS